MGLRVQRRRVRVRSKVLSYESTVSSSYESTTLFTVHCSMYVAMYCTFESTSKVHSYTRMDTVDPEDLHKPVKPAAQVGSLSTTWS